uniref:Transcription factor IIIB 50 kDa subunit n=1 Tax=Amphilophus citrinellus TaxID=61819 RepID=A0A3Q0SRP2_AMPCI
MSAAGMTCPGCGSTNIVDDDLYSQAQLVCVDCGSVVSEGVLANDPVGDVSFSRTTAVAKKPCANQIKGLQRVKAICRILMVNSEIEALSQTYYKMAYEHKAFLKVSLQKKDILTGCCVLVSCRLLNWPITIGTISCLLDADPMVVGAVYQEMVKNLSIEAPIVNEVLVSASNFKTFDVPEELAENSRDLTKRAVALVELAADSWIVTGRKPIPIMMAATYLAWQSLKPNKHRLKFSLDKFCQIAKVKKLKPAMKRVAEIKEVLCKLGKEIPWVGGAMTPNNVIQQVECILQHRYALLRRAMRTHEDTPVTSVVKQNGSNSQDPSGNWGKRVLFAPPCVIHPKKRRVEQCEHKDVTGDEEISDSEIDSYIRTPREARDFSQTQELKNEADTEVPKTAVTLVAT